MAFVPIGTTDGSDWHGKMREVEIAAALASNVFLGDMMNLSGTGSADGRAEGVILGTFVTNTQLAGAVVEFLPDFTDEGSLVRNFHLQSTAQRAKLVYGSDVIYEAPDIPGTLAITDIGSNRLLGAGAGGSTVTGISTHGIGAVGTAATDPLRIIGFTNTEGDAAQTIPIGTAFATWRCRLNFSVDDHRLVGV